MFNQSNIWERTKNGEFMAIPVGTHIPNSPGEPFGTVSQMLSIRRIDGFEIARVHVYLRPDGTLGGSGMADPKIVYDEQANILYMQERKSARG
jgi:hypothetical protein